MLWVVGGWWSGCWVVGPAPTIPRPPNDGVGNVTHWRWYCNVKRGVGKGGSRCDCGDPLLCSGSKHDQYRIPTSQMAVQSEVHSIMGFDFVALLSRQRSDSRWFRPTVVFRSTYLLLLPSKFTHIHNFNMSIVTINFIVEHMWSIIMATRCVHERMRSCATAADVCRGWEWY